MKKVIFISTRPIYPIIGGDQIRTAQQLEFLVQRFKVDVLYLYQDEEIDRIREFVPDVHEVYRFRISKVRHYLQTLRFFFNNKPLQVNYYFNNTVKAFVDSRINKYDYAFCNNIRTAEYMRNIQWRGVKIIDLVDSISMNYAKAKLHSKGLKKLIYTIDSKRCLEYERLLVQEFDSSSLISEIDKKYVQTENLKDILVIGNKVSIPPIESVSKHDKEDLIVFVGKMNYAPNVVAATYFAETILPKLKVSFPNIIFKIVGAKPSKEVFELSNNPSVIVTGFVDSVEPYFQNATIVVAPMLTGAGIQNKIIQAMSYGCCVVTTPIGAEGLSINHGEISILDGDDSLINGISSLLRDREKRVKMGKAARQVVINNYSEEIIAKQFWELVDK